eukprot:IDg17359t1
MYTWRYTFAHPLDSQRSISLHNSALLNAREQKSPKLQHAMAAFIASGATWAAAVATRRRASRARVCVCAAADPEPPRDPGALRSESSRRRNSAPKPMRRRRRRRRRRADDDEELDWAQMDSVPLV